MANNSYYASSITCELKVIGAKNIETKQKGNLFIRCYLSVGNNNNKRIQINTKEISSSQKDGYIFWDDTFSLECNGTRDSIVSLGNESVCFELRWRNKKNFLGKVGGPSKVIATAEMPWKDVFGAPKREIQRWVVMSVNDNNGKLLKVEDGVKPPALQVAMKVDVVTTSVEEMRRRKRLMGVDECGCRLNRECCCSCVDNELLLVGATLDGF
ncbi:Cartilage-associated protein [Bienertia sinuspersici]